jgi:2-oxoisovalerate dehydrogenase E2 component (dihydrolipoyl transacylase)
MATTIKMPQLGESVTEGTIERWLVKEGDTVEQYDPLFEVVTDKVNAEVPAEIAGTITKIMVPDGETVAVGTPLAEIDAEGAGADTEEPAGEAPAEAPAAEAAAEQPAETPAEAPPQEAQPEAASDAGPEAVAQQEPAPAEPEQPAEAVEAAPPAEPGRQAAAAPVPTTAQEPAAGAGANGGGGRMTPAVRRLVREHGIDIAQLSGSGAGGRVTRDDVMAFIAKGAQAPAAQAQSQPAQAQAQAAPAQAQPAQPEAQAQAEPAQATAPAPAPAAPTQPAAEAPAPAPRPTPPSVPAPSGGDTELPLSKMRMGIAKKMTQVKQTVPHAYTVVEVDMTNVVKWREANNMAFKAREGASLSYVAVVVKAVTETLRKHPTLNSQFAEDRIILKQAMNIGIAVAVDNGLIVPVIANADQLSISGVNARIRDISSRAHAGKLRLDELQGGTFTVNNTGWFGSVSSMPIINAPEVAILSMEAIVKRPRVMEVDGADVIAIRHMMNMTCSFDHRVLDGAQVGFFLADVRTFLEEWDANTPLG